MILSGQKGSCHSRIKNRNTHCGPTLWLSGPSGTALPTAVPAGAIPPQHVSRNVVSGVVLETAPSFATDDADLVMSLEIAMDPEDIISDS